MAEEQQDDSQERSLEASEQRLKQAREKGNVPQSKEITTTLLYAGMMVTLLLAGGSIAMNISRNLSRMMINPKEYGDSFLYSPDKEAFRGMLTELSAAVMPLFLIPVIFVLLSLFAQQAITFAPDKLKPKWSRLSPVSNAKQKFGPSGLGEFVKSFAKLAAVGIIASLYLWQQFFDLPRLSQLPAQILPGQMKDNALALMLFVVLTSAAIAAVDWPWVRYQHQKKLRMTFQEMKQETKENEGDPYQKSARRKRAEELATNSMLRDVADADVVIVNPEHYAVALKWERENGTVPVCVAKGVDALAFRIREKAKLADVPVHSDPPCARSLHALVEVGEMIRPEHYAAVAAAIHFADQVRKGLRNA